MSRGGGGFRPPPGSFRVKKDVEAAVLSKQLEELDVTDKTGNHIAAWKTINLLCSDKNARRVYSDTFQMREQAVKTSLVYLLTMTVVWLLWKYHHRW